MSRELPAFAYLTLWCCPSHGYGEDSGYGERHCCRICSQPLEGPVRVTVIPWPANAPEAWLR